MTSQPLSVAMVTTQQSDICCSPDRTSPLPVTLHVLSLSAIILAYLDTDKNVPQIQYICIIISNYCDVTAQSLKGTVQDKKRRDESFLLFYVRNRNTKAKWTDKVAPKKGVFFLKILSVFPCQDHATSGFTLFFTHTVLFTDGQSLGTCQKATLFQKTGPLRQKKLLHYI